MNSTAAPDPVVPASPNANSPSKAWMRALELAATIPRNPQRLMADVVEQVAARQGDAPALLSDRESMTYRQLSDRASQYARWALQQGLARGEVVCLLMPNRPEYFAVWLGIGSVGGVVALLNTNLTGASLAHCINAVHPRHIIAAAAFIGTLADVRPLLAESPTLWSHGADHSLFQRIDHEIEQFSTEALSPDERRTVTIEDRALFIYTSGTTGLPKAASVSHARVLQWSHWFAGMMGVQPSDRMYNCLPMYHSVGGVQAIGAALVGGGSVVIREKFSASQFWSDIVRWECTTFQYIGELCRYLLHAASPTAKHGIRIACGNGLAPEIWEKFKERFQIPRILEFYASTEGGVSLFNVEGKTGAIGRIPPYLAHRFSPALVRFDFETGEPARDEQGRCIRCVPQEAGEALGKLADDPSAVGTRFEGYTDAKASARKIVRDVFTLGDAWIRTGDLMRKDEQGFFYFVDRVGDTFRWKGENVATTEVAEAVAAFPGVTHANVYGVAINSADGRAGMVALVAKEAIDLKELRTHLASRLPAYARPLFVRIGKEVEVTGTFKYSKTELVREGCDPGSIADPLYFDSPEAQGFVPLDKALYERIQTGQIRL